MQHSNLAETNQPTQFILFILFIFIFIFILYIFIHSFIIHIYRFLFAVTMNKLFVLATLCFTVWEVTSIIHNLKSATFKRWNEDAIYQNLSKSVISQVLPCDKNMRRKHFSSTTMWQKHVTETFLKYKNRVYVDRSTWESGARPASANEVLPRNEMFCIDFAFLSFSGKKQKKNNHEFNFEMYCIDWEGPLGFLGFIGAASFYPIFT